MQTLDFRDMEIKHDLHLGDCEQLLKRLPADSVDLIFTSPPYADQRKKTYGGIHPAEYPGSVALFAYRTEFHKTKHTCI